VLVKTSPIYRKLPWFPIDRWLALTRCVGSMYNGISLLNVFDNTANQPVGPVWSGVDSDQREGPGRRHDNDCLREILGH
jgi:hypothetical protein